MRPSWSWTVLEAAHFGAKKTTYSKMQGSANANLAAWAELHADFCLLKCTMPLLQTLVRAKAGFQNAACVKEITRSCPILPPESECPRMGSGRSPDLRFIGLSSLPRSLYLTKPSGLFAQPPRLQLRGSDGFSPSSRTPEKKSYHPCNYWSSANWPIAI